MSAMSPIIVDCEQRSPEWFLERCGKVTASRVCDVVAKLKKKDAEAAARWNYKLELVCETIRNQTFEHYVSKPMELGIENEPLARAAYEIETDVEVEQVGLVVHPTIERFAASPDGLVGDDGLLEIKCPLMHTHLNTRLKNEVPEEYIWQVQAQMSCTGRQWCDFVSYFPCDKLGDKQMLKIRVPRSDELISVIELEVVQFLSEVDAILESLKVQP